MSIHRRFAELLETIFDEICDIKATAETDNVHRPFYPMLDLPHPEGLDLPEVHRRQEDRGLLAFPPGAAGFRPRHRGPLRGSQNWLESYKPEELFDANGAVKDDVLAFMPKGELRIGANPNANGGVIRNDLKLPNLEDYEVKEVAEYGHGWGPPRPPVPWVPTLATSSRTTRATSASSDRMRPLPTVCRTSYEVTNKQWDAGYNADEVDEHMHVSGQVVEQLSEHQMRRLPRGLPADRSSRHLELLRVLRPRDRLHAEPARQVA